MVTLREAAKKAEKEANEIFVNVAEVEHELKTRLKSRVHGAAQVQNESPTLILTHMLTTSLTLRP